MNYYEKVVIKIFAVSSGRCALNELETNVVMETGEVNQKYGEQELPNFCAFESHRGYSWFVAILLWKLDTVMVLKPQCLVVM